MLFKLPEDLLPHIISFFSLKEIYHCLQFVSKEWMQISNPPSLYHKKKGTYPENNYQQWTSYIVSSFQIGKQFREFNSIDDDKNPICNVVWDDNHTELIFSCMERRMASGLLEGKMLVKTTGIDEMIKSMQFLYGVHYDKELVKRIKDDSSIQSCIYAEHEEFFTCYQDRLKDNSNSVKESFYFMDLCYLESNLKGVGDELFYYKLFERVFALDLDYDWSKVFPAIRKCKLLKQKRGEGSNRELIRKMFLLEMEVALKMLGNICEWSFYQSNLDVLYQFAHYCKSTQSQSEMIVKLSNALINQINRLVLSEAVILTPIIDRDISVLDSFKDNTLIQLFNENEMTLELVDYRSLYTNVSFVLEFLYRNFSVADMLRRTDKRHRVIEPINILNGYIEQYILNHKDLEKRVCFYEKIVQAFVYAVELKDFKTAFFFVNIFNASSISRLRKTSQLAESPNNFNTLLNESLSKLSSDSNFRKLYQTIQKYAHESSVPINLPLTSLTFVMEGNSNQNVILLFSYKIISEFGRTLKIPSKIGKFERELLEKKIVKIIDKKGLKESIKSFFEGGDSINFQHQLQTDRELLELFVCIVLKFQPQSESELWKMSLVCEPRQSNK